MNGHSRPNRWVAILFVAIVAVVVGVLSYNAGVQHGLAMSPALERAAAGAGAGGAGGAAATPAPYPYPYPYPYYGFHPWFGGFGFFFPLVFFAFWFLVIRFLFWGGPWRRRSWHHGNGERRDVPPMFEEWHRRMHERMTNPHEDSAGRG
jgi:hypothetical protein